MYLKRLKVVNFGVIEEKEEHFQDGLIVVRAANGAGKTTFAIQAVLYLFFGSSTLESSVDEVVLEGAKVTSMYVEGEYGPYKIKRSKGSASVEGDGKKISGQDEVSNFFYDLFGLTKGTAELILVANQGDIDGVVKKKPAEIMKFIESIAGFDQIEELIERVKVQFPSGNKEIYEEAMATTEAELEGAAVTLVEIGELVVSQTADLTVKELELAELSKRVLELSTQIASISVLITNNEAYLKEQTANRAEVQRLKSKLEELVKRITELESVSIELLPEAEVESLKKGIEGFQQQLNLYARYKACTSLPKSTVSWEGDETNFLAELTALEVEEKELEATATRLRTQISINKRSIPKDTVCPTCLTDLSEKVGKLREELNSKIAQDAELLKVAEAGLLEVVDSLTAMKSIKTVQGRLVNLLTDGEDIFVNRSVVPWEVTWVAEVPTKPDVLENEKKKKTLEDNNKRFNEKLSNAKLLAELSSQQVELDKKIVDAELKCDHEDKTAAVKLNIAQLNEEFQEVTGKAGAANLSTESLRKFISNLQLQVAGNEVRKGETNKRIVALNDSITSYARKIKEDADNALVLKHMREARPRIISKIWDSIVIAVGERYKQITGSPETLVKSDKGFKLGIRPTSRLSGSEKAVLGIAFRETLRGIFAPGCGFLALDEPTASMDESRTQATLGAIQEIGGQIILVTHDDDIEIFAEQVITIDQPS
jgi:DNA repair exonuclease SbcCD ATPase subunit